MLTIRGLIKYDTESFMWLMEKSSVKSSQKTRESPQHGSSWPVHLLHEHKYSSSPLSAPEPRMLCKQTRQTCRGLSREWPERTTHTAVASDSCFLFTNYTQLPFPGEGIGML